MSPPPSPEDPPDALVGIELSGYQIRSVIGKGGTGKVYLAVHPVVGARAAIKVLLPEFAADREQTERFVREARVLATLNHDRIVKIMGFGQLPDGANYMITEHLEGASLARIIEREAPMAPARALALVDQILDALSAAHAAGVVHRDLKPLNVIVKTVGTERKIKLLDFGLARARVVAVALDSNRALTRESSIAGTPEYIAPEQARGFPPSPASDLYSLGVMLFEMLTQRLPFVATTASEMMSHHVYSQPFRVSELVPGTPPLLDDLVAQLLAKAPEERGAPSERVRKLVQRLQRELPEPEPVGRKPSTGSGEFPRPILLTNEAPRPPTSAPAPPKIDPAYAAAREKAQPSRITTGRSVAYVLGLSVAVLVGMAVERFARSQATAPAGKPAVSQAPVGPVPTQVPAAPAPVVPAPTAPAVPTRAVPTDVSPTKVAPHETGEVVCADLGQWKQELPSALDLLSKRYVQRHPSANPEKPPLAQLTDLLDIGRSADNLEACADAQRGIDAWELKFLGRR